MSATTRDRILEAGGALFRRAGFNGVGIKQIAAEASAPMGSLYHFFPGGKDHLAAEVIRRSGHAYGELVPMVFDAEPDVAIATRNFFIGAARALSASDFEDACPIAAVALEVASTNEPLRIATAEVFEGWIETLAARLAKPGLAPERARDLAVAMIAILEGAFVLSRATRDARHVEVAGELMSAAVAAALASNDAGSISSTPEVRRPPPPR